LVVVVVDGGGVGGGVVFIFLVVRVVFADIYLVLFLVDVLSIAHIFGSEKNKNIIYNANKYFTLVQLFTKYLCLFLYVHTYIPFILLSYGHFFIKISIFN